MNPRRWWFRRTLRFRITVVATGVALLCLLAFTGLAPALIGLVQITAVDQELEKSPPRVLDVSGVPVDGEAPLPLTAQDIRTLKSGQPVLRLDGESAHRFRGRVVFPIRDAEGRVLHTAFGYRPGEIEALRARIEALLPREAHE